MTDSAMSVRQPLWANQGVVLKKPPKTIEAAIKASGLNWEVIQYPVFFDASDKDNDAESNMRIVPETWANVRSDTQGPLGIVTTRYKPVQNIEAFSFLAEIFGSEMHFEAAGSMQNGRRVWVLLKIPDFVSVGGDDVGQYAFISNSHDGKGSVVSACTPYRFICGNMIPMATRQAKGFDAKRVVTIRHTGNIEKKIEEARTVLDVTVNYYKQFTDLGDALALQKVSPRKLKMYIENLLPINEDQGDRAARNKEEARQVVQSIFRGEGKDGDTSGNAPGSFWCLYNAAVEFADWYRPERKDGGRLQRAIDDPDGFKNNAFELALAGAGLR
jgi:phage/plasmid-like protein (TIGR03299 family)